MGDELKSCPFCGSNNISSGEIMGKNPEGDFYQQTSCLDCGASGPSSLETPSHDCDEGWNKRA